MDFDSSTKVPLDASSAFTILLPAIATYFVTALLAILPGKVLIRRALLPLTLLCILRAVMYLDVSGGDPKKAHANQAFGLVMFMMSMRSIGWGILSGHVKASPGSEAGLNKRELSTSRRAVLLNASDLAFGFRELGWQGPSKPKTLLQGQPAQSQTHFLRKATFSGVLHLALCDFLQFGMQWFEPDSIGAPIGGSIFDPSLPCFKRYLRSTFISILFGGSIYVATQTVYLFFSVFGVAILRQSPNQWPPLFHSPWCSASLRELWGDRWHHLNRNYMIIVAARPLKRIAGEWCGLIGAFALSGLLHDLGLRAVGRGSDFVAVFGFFFMMGVGVIVESLWARWANKSVSGVYGWLWTSGWVALWGNGLVNAWLIRGAAAGSMVPDPVRPSKLVLSFIYYLAGTVT
ncbi:hypothetical protein PAXRUDRAFT_339915 [Paxillus rubicundulus Ve08.2h10]|uniref:Wax synthase domain-containing protein n=1 Tax=Paxillus rubicundulus Ve08.2h10 TaxID=930991 RepID=A0A0D0DS23_9AGAM|nr:hypothetical protein PAXRUDRAFT_339915 [Paxillus rubicundulus Ve08.2h10]